MSGDSNNNVQGIIRIYGDADICIHYYKGEGEATIIYPFSPEPFFIVDFILRGGLHPAPLQNSEGSYCTCFYENEYRDIHAEQGKDTVFFSIAFSAGYLKKKQIIPSVTRGRITAAMLLLVLKIMAAQHKSKSWIAAHASLLGFEAIRTDQEAEHTDFLPYADALQLFTVIDGLTKKPQPYYTAQAFAEASGLKNYRFKKACRQLYKCSFNHILHDLLMENAMLLIVFSDEPLEKIGLATGYSSRENFITAFRKHYHITPLAIRNFYRQGNVAAF